jgi:hypothetical protein
MDAVELKQVSIGFHRTQVIDGHDLNICSPRFDN